MNERISCNESTCMFNKGDSCCEAGHIQVSMDDDKAACYTFTHENVRINTASERMMGVRNGTIGDGEMTQDYMRVEFSEPFGETVANAPIGCTVSNCRHFHEYVCRAECIEIGQEKNNYADSTCKTFSKRKK